MTDPTREAFEHYNAGRLDEAAKLCHALVAREPESPEINHLLGVILFRQGDTTAARACSRSAPAPGSCPCSPRERVPSPSSPAKPWMSLPSVRATSSRRTVSPLGSL